MEYTKTLRARLRTGNKFSIETGSVVKRYATELSNNVKSGELGGNCVEFFVKSGTFDSLVGFNYVTSDKRYLVTVIFEPENTTEYKDVEPGSYILTKIA